MFSFIRFLGWTAVSMGLGVFLATYEVDGKTLFSRGQGLWKSEGAGEKLDGVTGNIQAAISEARRHAAHKDTPVEHHSDADKSAVNELVAKRTR